MPDPGLPLPVRFTDGAVVVRDRSGDVCEVCRGVRGRAAQTHHRQARGMGGVSRAGLAVNRPSALIRVCLSCHAWIESYRDAAEALGLLVPRPGVPGEVPAWLHTAYGRGWFSLDDEGCYGFVDRPDPVGARPAG